MPKTSYRNPYVDSQTKLLLGKFEDLIAFKPKDRKAGRGRTEGWGPLAIKQTCLLKATYPDTAPETERTYTTCRNQITRLKKALRAGAASSLKDPENKARVLTICAHFGEALSDQFTQYGMKKAEAYRAKVETRSMPENRIQLNLTQFIKRAHEVLSNPENFTWIEVSCAIALTAGRRMAEVHMSANFEPIEGESHLMLFTGQLKGKGRKMGDLPLHQHTFTIPTLVPASLVINGLQHLADEGKRVDYNPKWTYDHITYVTPKVNGRYNKELNLLTKKPQWAVLPDGAMTYHKFRGAYLRACIVNSKVDPFDYIDYVASIIGDRDESTIKSYQRFSLKEGSITLI